MTTVYEIETAVAHLPQQGLTEFRAWFDAFDAKNWDDQIQTDAVSGKLDALANEALRDFSEGRSRSL